jgi:hypothetical protein
MRNRITESHRRKTTQLQNFRRQKETEHSHDTKILILFDGEFLVKLPNDLFFPG